MTPLDQAHALMQATPEDDAPRLRYYERLAACELFVLLDAEAEGERISPRTITLDGAAYLLAFDTEARLAGFTTVQAPFAAMSGRQVVAMLAGRDMGLGINLEAAPSSMLLPPEAIDWLAEALGNRAEETSQKPVEFTTPYGADQGLLRALDAKFAAAPGLAHHACLAQARYEGGQSGLLLAIVDALAPAEPALRQAVVEAVSFSDSENTVDVVFLKAEDAYLARLEKVGLGFDFPVAEVGERIPTAPGTDPENPPILR